MQCLPATIYYLYVVAYLYISQALEYCRIAPGAIEVSIDDCASSIAGMGSEAVPSHIVPGIVGWRCQVAIRSNAYRLNERIDSYGRNDQAFRNERGSGCWTHRSASCWYCRSAWCCCFSLACLFHTRFYPGNSRAAARAWYENQHQYNQAQDESDRAHQILASLIGCPRSVSF
jgi:hypothetical protein